MQVTALRRGIRRQVTSGLFSYPISGIYPISGYPISGIYPISGYPISVFVFESFNPVSGILYSRVDRDPDIHLLAGRCTLHTLAPVCASVLIAHWGQVCTGLPSCCAHRVIQQLQGVRLTSVLAVCFLCALQCAQVLIIMSTLSPKVYAKRKSNKHT